MLKEEWKFEIKGYINIINYGLGLKNLEQYLLNYWIFTNLVTRIFLIHIRAEYSLVEWEEWGTYKERWKLSHTNWNRIHIPPNVGCFTHFYHSLWEIWPCDNVCDAHMLQTRLCLPGFEIQMCGACESDLCGHRVFTDDQVKVRSLV